MRIDNNYNIDNNTNIRNRLRTDLEARRT